MASQSEDFKWFTKNLNSLYKLYPNKNIVIQDKQVVCVGDSFEDALVQVTSKGLELGTFIIQECGKDENCYTQSFGPNVVFA